MPLKPVNPCPDPRVSMTMPELEKFLLFGIAVAGKKASTIVKALDSFLTLRPSPYCANIDCTPFEQIRMMRSGGMLIQNLVASGLGQYTKLSKAYIELTTSDINLRKCSLEELLEIHGIGNKTARFFLLHTRLNQRYAVLDTHILRWFRERGYNMPESTPTSNKEYKRLEQIVLTVCDSLGMSPLDFDSIIWKAGAKVDD